VLAAAVPSFRRYQPRLHDQPRAYPPTEAAEAAELTTDQGP
jgi:hypothetical protein